MVPVLLLLIVSTLPAVASASNDASTGEVISTKAKASSDVAHHLARQEQSSSLTNQLAFITKLAERDAIHEINRTVAENNALDLIKNLLQSWVATMLVQHGEDTNETGRLMQSITDCANQLKDESTCSEAVTKDANRDFIYECFNEQQSDNAARIVRCSDFHDSLFIAAPVCLNNFAQTFIMSSPTQPADTDAGACLEFAQPWINSIILHKDTCDDATAELAGKTGDCATKQSTFEVSTCTWAKALDDACTAMQDCRSAAIPARVAAIAQIDGSMQARKADFVASQRALCLFTVFDAPNADKRAILDACIADDHPSTQFDIDFNGTVADAPTCPAAIVLPGNPGWESLEYGSYQGGTITIQPTHACLSVP